MFRSAVFALVLAFSVVTLTGCRAVKPQAPPPQASTPPAAAAVDPGELAGTVAETMDAAGYTYARLQATGREDVWIAASAFPAKVGDRLTVPLEAPMANFESKTLNRTFPLVYFVSRVARDGEVVSGAAIGAGEPPLMTSHAPVAAAAAVEPVAPPPGGLSIADVWAQRKALSGKAVTVRGQVVKVNNQILDRNWIHLQDGSGAAADRTNDLTVTTDAAVKVGDIVTVTGVLATGKDIGGGYAYDAIVEHAKVVK